MLKRKLLRAVALSLNVAIVYYIAAIVALIATGGYEFELFGLRLSSNRIDPLAAGLAVAGVLRLSLALQPLQCLMVLTSSALALAASETLVRVLAPAMAQPALVQIHQPSTRYGFELVPGSDGVGLLGERITINADGARDEPFAPRGDRRRIVAVGDSFTFGFGVDLQDAYVKQLEAKLGEHADVEVLNLGVSAYNFWQYLQVLEHRVPGLAPDLVLIGFYLDDLGVSKRPASVVPENPFAQQADEEFTASALVNLVRNLWTTVEARYRYRRGYKYLASIEERRQYFAHAEHTRVAEQALTGTLPTARYDAFRAAIDELAAWSHAHQIPVLVVFIPDAIQLGDPTRQSINRTVAIETARAGIDFVDATPVFEAQDDPRALYLFPLDAHTSKTGNALIAQTIALHPAIRALVE